MAPMIFDAESSNDALGATAPPTGGISMAAPIRVPVMVAARAKVPRLKLVIFIFVVCVPVNYKKLKVAKIAKTKLSQTPPI